MKVFVFLLFLFIVIPLMELGLLLGISFYMEWWWQTLLLVVVTGVVGATLARQQGWQTWMRLKQNISNREMPTDAVLDGMMILVAGAFLITPGILTDSMGFLLLFPPFRGLVKRPVIFWLRTSLFSRFQPPSSFAKSGFSSMSDVASVFNDSSEPTSNESNDIIDVPFTRKTDD